MIIASFRNYTTLIHSRFSSGTDAIKLIVMFLLILFLFLQLLNQIVCELPPEHPVAHVRPLRDSLGHTPLQV